VEVGSTMGDEKAEEEGDDRDEGGQVLIDKYKTAC